MNSEDDDDDDDDDEENGVWSRGGVQGCARVRWGYGGVGVEHAAASARLSASLAHRNRASRPLPSAEAIFPFLLFVFSLVLSEVGVGVFGPATRIVPLG